MRKIYLFKEALISFTEFGRPANVFFSFKPPNKIFLQLLKGSNSILQYEL